MIAITMSLALTYGLLRTQVSTLQLTQNDQRRDLALEAARAGMSAALLRLQSPTWPGISDVLTRITLQDTSNRAAYTVRFSAPVDGELSVPAAELPLHLKIVSTGTWTSPRDSSTTVQRTIQSFVRLMPRIPGRTVRAGDVASATDLAVNSAATAAMLPYSLTVTSTSNTTLTFDAGARIEGPVWLNRGMSLFSGEKWSSTIRGVMLTEIGNQLGMSTPFAHPHPLDGPIRFVNNPSGSLQTDLGRLKTPWSTAAQAPTTITVSATPWQNYRLYNGGPQYQAVTVSSSLTNVTLRPTPANPLGIFVRSGNLDLYDNVTLQGTLIVTGTLTFWGSESIISAYNWIGSSGPVISGADKWPRLPAVVAKQISCSSSARQIVEGAVLVESQLSSAGGNFGFNSSNWVNLTGTATAARGEQPYSTVQLVGSPDLTAISGGAEFAIWLASGARGRWYPIHAVDRSQSRLTVVGEASVSTPVSYRIRPNRSSFIAIHGPVIAGTVVLEDQPMWGIASLVWNNTYSDWNQTNAIRSNLGQPRIPFTDWVTNPANLVDQGWFIPLQTMIYGLQLEPTFSIQPAVSQNSLVAAPLFTPYVSSGADQATAGYRWKVIDWREDL